MSHKNASSEIYKEQVDLNPWGLSDGPFFIKRILVYKINYWICTWMLQYRFNQNSTILHDLSLRFRVQSTTTGHKSLSRKNQNFKCFEGSNFFLSSSSHLLTRSALLRLSFVLFLLMFKLKLPLLFNLRASSTADLHQLASKHCRFPILCVPFRVEK